jgi:hypothetical protein
MGIDVDEDDDGDGANRMACIWDRVSMLSTTTTWSGGRANSRNGYTTAASLPCPAASPSASIDRGKRAGIRGRARDDGVQDDTVMAKRKIRATIVELCDDDMTTMTTETSDESQTLELVGLDVDFFSCQEFSRCMNSRQ